MTDRNEHNGVEWIDAAGPSAPPAPSTTTPAVRAVVAPSGPTPPSAPPTAPPELVGRSVAAPSTPPSVPNRFGEPARPPLAGPAGPLLPPTPPPGSFAVVTPAIPPAPSRPSWGWRTLVAFVAGGSLAAAGFAAAQVSEQAEPEETATVAAAPAATNPSTQGTIQPPVIVEPPDLDTSEPAAFVASLLGPSVVQIEVPNLGLGSGVVYGDGLIITNNHVIDGSTTVKVRTSEGRVLDGEVVGGDPRTDIAVISVGPDSGLPVANLALGEELEVGQATIAIGSPFSLQQTVTSGIVSATYRPIFNGVGLNAMIQTDAAINPGNSGGALADRSGRVIGINTSIQTDGTGNSNIGVGFAVPIDTAVNIAGRITGGQPMEPGFLGVSGDFDPDGSAGVFVTEVTSGSAAEAAGLMVGDLVVKLGGAPVTNIEELAGLIQTRFPGDDVTLELVRDGEVIELTATLGER